MTGSTLGYYAAPSFTAQELAFPVYAVTAEVRGRPLGAVPGCGSCRPLRPRRDRRRRIADPAEGRRRGSRRGRPCVRRRCRPGCSVSSAVLRARGLSPEDLLFRDGPARSSSSPV